LNVQDGGMQPDTSTTPLPAAPARVSDFVRQHPDAAVCTVRADGTVHTARIELGVVDGRVRTAGAPGLVRTRNLRREPRCSLFVFGPHPYWLGLETRARILDGPDAPTLLVELMRARHGDAAPPGTVLAHDDELERDRPYPEDEYRRRVREAGLFVVDFEITRCYGYDAPVADPPPPSQTLQGLRRGSPVCDG
jgi:hypothetical protein